MIKSRRKEGDGSAENREGEREGKRGPTTEPQALQMPRTER